MRLRAVALLALVALAGCGSSSHTPQSASGLPTFRPDMEQYMKDHVFPGMPAAQANCIVHSFDNLSAAEFAHLLAAMLRKDQQAMDTLGQAAGQCVMAGM